MNRDDSQARSSLEKSSLKDIVLMETLPSQGSALHGIVPQRHYYAGNRENSAINAHMHRECFPVKQYLHLQEPSEQVFVRETPAHKNHPCSCQNISNQNDCVKNHYYMKNLQIHK